jgi:hypothetical protein
MVINDRHNKIPSAFFIVPLLLPYQSFAFAGNGLGGIIRPMDLEMAL